MELRAAIDDFLLFCAVERQLARNTLQAYANDLADFNAWRVTSNSTTEISTETLKAYLQAMVTERKLSAATVRRRLACLRAFFRRFEEAQQGSNPFAGWRLALPRRKKLPRSLSRGEVGSLLSCPSRPLTMAHVLDGQMATAVRLMVATGLRVGELCGLRVEDFAPDGSSLRIHGKGSRDRVAYIADTAFQRELQILLKNREHLAGPGGPMFVNRHGSKVQPQSIRLRLHRAARAAGLSRRITPHMLRHTAATLLIETGVDIRIVQRLLGHSSIATTEIYTHVSDEALRTTLKRANVLQAFSTS